MTRLHIGCGPLILDGWVNIDNVSYPGVDRVLDVTRKSLPYKDVDFIFAEHFIEHISYPDAVRLLTEFRRVLSPEGVLRLSTPNLDWVWMTHYRLHMEEAEAVQGAFIINRAFRGWGHQFLYNEATLMATLREAGFSSFRRVQYGVSEHAELCELERHERSPDWGSLQDILILEASGTGGAFPEDAKSIRAEFLRDIGVK